MVPQVQIYVKILGVFIICKMISLVYICEKDLTTVFKVSPVKKIIFFDKLMTIFFFSDCHFPGCMTIA